jgi:septal ring factor EnvC (AmiA/AmiB activator)
MTWSGHNRILPMLAAFAALVLSASSGAEDADEAQLNQKLEQVRRQIAALQLNLQRTRESRDVQVADLRSIEREVGAISLAIKSSDRAIGRLQDRQGQLRSEQQTLESELASQRKALEAQLRTAYALGLQPRLKLLLSQSDAGVFSRNMVYFKYYNQARVEQIEQVDQQLARLASIKREIATARKQQELTGARLQTQHREKRLAMSRRQEVVDALVQKMGQQETRLTRLGQDQNHTRTLVTALRDIFADIPPDLEGRPFAGLLGTLSWPSQGTLRLPPGQDNPDGMNRQGALVAAAAGTEVHVISHGRVAYADWLRGFGLLTIIDHGDGYLSLYGFNESLLKGVGDWVMPGEVIASVGNSGGREQPALYFELRKDGLPIDLRPWLKTPRP